jgi:hypothetical protein
MPRAQIDDADAVLLFAVVQREIPIACPHLVSRVTLCVAELATNVVFLRSVEIARESASSDLRLDTLPCEPILDFVA